MSYPLENINENQRLEKQSTQSQYLIENELRFLNLRSNQVVLDAGCGSGIVSRAILDHEPTAKVIGVDASELRLKQAERATDVIKRQKIEFRQGSLTDLPVEDESVDVVVCRFVYEYLQDPHKVAEEFKRVLKPNGVAYIIDVDGLHFNLWTANEKLNALVEELRTNLNIDMFAGRKLKSYLLDTGFNDVQVKVDVENFETAEDMSFELENNIQRFAFAKKEIEIALNSQDKAEQFVELYLKEMEDPRTVLFFNKFIVWGTK